MSCCKVPRKAQKEREVRHDGKGSADKKKMENRELGRDSEPPISSGYGAVLISISVCALQNEESG